MSQKDYKLTYFDMSGGRGEAIRLAFLLGDIAFEDIRFSFSEWGELREKAPFHQVPFLELDGQVVAQSNALLRYVGKLAGLYPEDPYQALLCDELLESVEDLWQKLGPTMGLEADALKAARKTLVEGPYTRYLEQFEARLKKAGGEFFADGRLTIADLQVFVFCQSLGSGHLDHIPQDLAQQVAPEVAKHQKRISQVPKIRDYYAKMFAKA